MLVSGTLIYWYTYLIFIAEEMFLDSEEQYFDNRKSYCSRRIKTFIHKGTVVFWTGDTDHILELLEHKA